MRWQRAADQSTDKQQQSTIARWTAEKICEMGVDAFYALPDPELKTMFERDTSMRYEDVPNAPTDTGEVPYYRAVDGISDGGLSATA